MAGDPIRFGGKELDAENGLNYFGARYYRNTLGRFTTVDPAMNIALAVNEPQRWNGYAYVMNRPLVVTDPDGRCPLCIMAGAGAAVYGGRQVYQNVSQGRPWYDNVGVEATKGALIGATMGLAGPVTSSAAVGCVLSPACQASAIDSLEGVAGGAPRNVAGAGTSRSEIGAVIGHFDAGYAKVGRDLHVAVFDIPTEIWNKMTPEQRTRANQVFLDGLIDRRTAIKVVTGGPVRVPSTLAWEIHYLLGNGYTWNYRGDVLLPPN